LKYYKYHSKDSDTYFLLKVEGEEILYQRFPKLTQFPCWQTGYISWTDLQGRNDLAMNLTELTKEEMFIEIL